MHYNDKGQISLTYKHATNISEQCKLTPTLFVTSKYSHGPLYLSRVTGAKVL